MAGGHLSGPDHLYHLTLAADWEAGVEAGTAARFYRGVTGVVLVRLATPRIAAHPPRAPRGTIPVTGERHMRATSASSVRPGGDAHQARWPHR